LSACASPAAFKAAVEAGDGMPCVLSGLAAHWPMMCDGEWTVAALSNPRHRYARLKFKVDEQASDEVAVTPVTSTDADGASADAAAASSSTAATAAAAASKNATTHAATAAAANGVNDDNDDDDLLPEPGGSFKLPLYAFMQYLHHNRDDVPLYVFDGVFETEAAAAAAAGNVNVSGDDGGGGDSIVCGADILHEFAPPPLFQPDLFSLLGEVRRPPYRWLLVGPARSGSALHTDPLATSAWNTCIDGIKRWCVPRAKPAHSLSLCNAIRVLSCC
jgi:hypothetical protein